MENASKALIIAGGILIGLITISVLFFMFNRISELAGITSENTQQEELLAFNKGFEAYNKKLMYGVDVITVINKAIDNNKRYGIENDSQDEYYVDIALVLKNDLQTIVEYYAINDDKIKSESLSAKSLKKDTTYKLSHNNSKIIDVIINANSGKDDDDLSYDNAKKASNKIKLSEGGYKIIYYPAAEFKRRTFNCTSVKYNKYGRVCLMTFEEYIENKS